MAERFKALIPAEALTSKIGGIGEDGGESREGNAEKGVARLEYELSDKEGGVSQVGWVTVYMPRTDPDGVDVLSRVVGAMRRKLRGPGWESIHRPGYAYYWHQRQALLSVTVQVVESMPGAKGRGTWVWVNFGHVPGFEAEQ